MNVANYLTILRIFLVPFFFTELVSHTNPEDRHRITALAIFFAASLTDSLDGFLARITGKRTDLGRFLDPLADKLLLLSGFLGLLFVETLPYRPPLWITVTIVFRDLVIVTGLLVLYFITGKVDVRPNFLGKSTTAFQMATLVAILLALKISILLWNITAVLTIASCLVYVARDLSKLKN